MKKWEEAELIELSICDTEHGWTGYMWDGGYVGDGMISGHLTWDREDSVLHKSKNPS